MTQEFASTIEQDPAEAISSVSKLRRDDYPSDWQIVKLGEIIDIQGGSQPPKDQFIYEPREGYVRLLQIRDFGDKPVPTYVPKDKVTKFCNKEDIFIARYGASLGRIVTNMEGAYNVALAKVIFDAAVVFSKYMFYLLQTPYFQTPIHMISRSAQNGFNKGEIYPIEVPLAPLQSQKRIVAEIEKQFSRLDEAVANLKRVKANLKRYKAAVLKAAVEGKLTEDWRKQHPNVEPASKLLECILVERRSKWTGKRNYKAPAFQQATDLPPLPDGWTWATLEQLTDSNATVVYGILQPGPDSSNGVPYVRPTEIENDRINLASVRRTSPEIAKRYRRSALQEGDIILSMVGTIGKVALVPKTLDGGNITQSSVRIRPACDDIHPHFLACSLRSPVLIHQYDQKRLGTAVPRLNVEDVRLLCIPLAPLGEQQCIVAEVERRLSVIEELETTVQANLTRADRLRQSILQQAFCGRLSPGNGCK